MIFLVSESNSDQKKKERRSRCRMVSDLMDKTDVEQNGEANTNVEQSGVW